MPSLTLSQVAARFGTTRQAVLHLVKKGYLPAQKVGHFWTVDEADLVGFTPPKPGRKKKED